MEGRGGRGSGVCLVGVIEVEGGRVLEVGVVGRVGRGWVVAGVAWYLCELTHVVTVRLGMEGEEILFINYKLK